MPIFVIVWFISALSGLIVSSIFGSIYTYTSPHGAMIGFGIGGLVIWAIALASPLAFPVYKGVLPAIFPMIGLLWFGLGGFAAGWILGCICHCIADTTRYARLCQMTGGAPPSEIVPLEAIGILLAGAAVGIWLAKQGCPRTGGGEDFAIVFVQRFFVKATNNTSHVAQTIMAISVLGSFFAATRQFFVNMMAILFARPQVPHTW